MGHACGVKKHALPPLSFEFSSTAWTNSMSLFNNNSDPTNTLWVNLGDENENYEEARCICVCACICPAQIHINLYKSPKFSGSEKMTDRIPHRRHVLRTGSTLMTLRWTFSILRESRNCLATLVWPACDINHPLLLRLPLELFAYTILPMIFFSFFYSFEYSHNRWAFVISQCSGIVFHLLVVKQFIFVKVSQPFPVHSHSKHIYYILSKYVQSRCFARRSITLTLFLT